MTGLIHHLVSAQDWADSPQEYRPTSLSDEGFIHFSTAEQLPATSLRYCADVEDLLVVSVDPSVLDHEVRWEDFTGHGEFPHLYGPLPKSAAVAVTAYKPGAAFPDG